MQVEDRGYQWFTPNAEYKDLAGQSKSEVFYYVYQDKKVIRYESSNSSPYKQTAYVVLQSPSATNPVSLRLDYQLGIYLYTTTTDMGYVVARVPLASFADIANPCSVRRGLVLKNTFNPADAVSCAISQTATHWVLELQNFGTYYGDGFIIVELDILNKASPGWTDYWDINTYLSKTESLTSIPRHINQNNQAGGRIWVGVLPQSSYFRVYRNSRSFEERRAQKDEYAEINMRLYNQVSLPATTGTTNARVEIWLPVDYDIPNGG